MGLMETLCAGYLQLINIIVFVLSIALIVFASIILANTHGSLTYGIRSAYYWGILAIGILLFLISIIGCACVKKGNKILIFTYGILQFIIGVVVTVGGVFMILFAKDYLWDIAQTSPSNLVFNLNNGNGVLNMKLDASNYLLGLNQGCCSTTVSDKYLSCTASGNVGPCYSDISQFDNGLTSSGLSAGASVCSRVESSSATCGSANVQSWMLNFYNYAKPYLLPSGIGLTVVGSMLIIAFIGTIIVGCAHDASGSYGSGSK